MAKKDEAKIKFSADTKEFSAAIKQAGDTMYALRGELKLNEAQMANTGQSVEGLAKKHDLLVQQDAALSQKIEALNGKLEKAREIWGGRTPRRRSATPTRSPPPAPPRSGCAARSRP